MYVLMAHGMRGSSGFRRETHKLAEKQKGIIKRNWGAATESSAQEDW
jgi:hypothetical protein